MCRRGWHAWNEANRPSTARDMAAPVQTGAKPVCGPSRLIHSIPYIHMKMCEGHPARMKTPGTLHNVNTGPGWGQNAAKVVPTGISGPGRPQYVMVHEIQLPPCTTSLKPASFALFAPAGGDFPCFLRCGAGMVTISSRGSCRRVVLPDEVRPGQVRPPPPKRVAPPPYRVGETGPVREEAGVVLLVARDLVRARVQRVVEAGDVPCPVGPLLVARAASLLDGSPGRRRRGDGGAPASLASLASPHPGV
ncbi:hypothetical protein THAOC_27042 [Thalassiosira oceanica]|uniref:Uncharacterized protein n=1 Tax=Thalassiosira oceanica TaxID=159749 RepID=K0S3P4_THAOC|nr:hypothetical protein THAOC_27042 [Thalassiosira oceanica]|eukprot:EJK53512.1 hypothetical protein THAOC_27042 [Thalassiosira oceanica]